ncbi:uncharacterized protein DUF4402 [Gillisia sp. Hel_I_86]|uniref:DUF4402 domain-containing protein n=1 Tax=Gillisia sp. Hel_I_86 TaxID=1249981 RepID=UPI00119B07BE|nr:DUF4402 domain-containing protein [Gillisia sp. Hel_I_86]TVZ28393.1 uncharacterized protein DUF4402 [Gillisia sp. Hel_I_86]
MKSILLILFILMFALKARSQNSATSNVEARVVVVEPIKITKSVDLNFGNVIAGYTQGTIILSPDGTRIANGVQISNAVPGDVSAAEAVVTHGEYNYSISLPDDFTLFNESNPNQFMVINQFQVTPLPEITNQGDDVLRIGATLNLEANQSSGYYTNPSGFNVTVSYN